MPLPECMKAMMTMTTESNVYSLSIPAQCSFVYNKSLNIIIEKWLPLVVGVFAVCQNLA